jgi:putative flippase GtrA
VPTIEEFGIGCCVGGFNAAITCGLLKLAKNGPLWTKACAALACPVFLSVGASYKSKSCMDFAGGFILFGVVPSAAGIMAANYVQ